MAYDNEDEGIGADGLVGGTAVGLGAGALAYRHVATEEIGKAASIEAKQSCRFTKVINKVLSKPENTELVAAKSKFNLLEGVKKAVKTDPSAIHVVDPSVTKGEVKSFIKSATKDARSELASGLRKEMSSGVVWRNMPTTGKAKIITGTVAGIGLGIWAAHKLTRNGTSHRDRLAAERQAMSRPQGVSM